MDVESIFVGITFGGLLGLGTLFCVLISEIRRDRAERDRVLGELRAAYRALMSVRLVHPTPIPWMNARAPSAPDPTERESGPIPPAPCTRRAPRHETADGEPTALYVGAACRHGAAGSCPDCEATVMLSSSARRA